MSYIRQIRSDYASGFGLIVTGHNQKMAMTLAKIADATGLDILDIIGPSKKRDISWVRQATMHALRQCHPEKSLPQIGAFLGGRDHTTVMHGIKVHKQRYTDMIVDRYGRAI